MAGSPSSSSAPAQNVFWNPTAVPIAQVDTLTASGVTGAGQTITATVGIYPNQGSITYTTITGDTNGTAATGLQTLLAAAQDGRFQEITWTVSGAVITATAVTPGIPFSLASSSTGGATLTHAVVTANSSPNDAGNPANWNRANLQQLPQNGDNVIVQNSSVSLLWNLGALAGVQFASYTRWMSFTGSIGLPPVNTNGYVEYRPQYFQFSGPPGGILTMLLGPGQTGSGPTLERYNVGSQQTTLDLLGSGSPALDYSVYFLGTNVFNVLNLYGSSLGVATLPTETSAVQAATLLNGAAATFGAGCTFGGALTLNNAQAVLFDAPGSVYAQQSSSVTVQSSGGLSYGSVTALSGSLLTWLSDGSIGTLVLQTGATFDKSQDARPIQISASSQDGDTTTVRDPWNAITWLAPITFRNAITAGPSQVGPGRTFKIV